MVHQRLKLFPCPGCRGVGCLILNGLIWGYEEASQEKRLRGHHFICNPRRVRGRGCGYTFSAFCGETIKHFRICATSLWKILIAIAGGERRIRAFRAVLPDSFHERTMHRWWHRFARVNQSAIRSSLVEICPPPNTLSAKSAIQTIRHLSAAFSSHPCPVAAFQLRFQTGFL